MNLEKYLELRQKLISYKGEKYSELGQDVLVLLLYEFKKGGFFVEFGAFDGKTYSNTYILEKQFEWNGIVAEPGKIFHKELFKNRSCFVDIRAVTDKTGQILEFKETNDHLGLSGIIDHVYHNKDMHVSTRQSSAGAIYKVETISLLDLLKKYNSPKFIEYMSLDTEGSEAIILESFDFTQYQIGLLSVEHNYVESSRQRIKDILFKNGYKRILHEYSKYDDWFILDKLF